jgi:hypothetical protein
MIHRSFNQRFGSFEISTWRQVGVLELNSTSIAFKIPGGGGLKRARPKLGCSIIAKEEYVKTVANIIRIYSYIDRTGDINI